MFQFHLSKKIFFLEIGLYIFMEITVKEMLNILPFCPTGIQPAQCI